MNSTGSDRLKWERMDKSAVPIGVIAEHYFATCRTEGKTPKTLRSYEEKLRRFVRWLGSGTLDDFTIEAVRDYIAALQCAEKWEGHPYTPRTGALLSAQSVANHARVLKGFSTWAFEERLTPANVLSRLALPKAPRHLTAILTDKEVAHLLASIDDAGPLGCRDLTIITLLLDTGLRRAELVQLRAEDVHLDEGWLKVMGKGQKERVVPFGVLSTRMLTRYLTFERPAPTTGALFRTCEGEPITDNTIAMLFARLRRRSGIARLHPHLLRHTFATNYLIAGGDVFTLQQILGHTTLEMTRRYVTLASTHISMQHRKFSPMDRWGLPNTNGRRSDRRTKQVPSRTTRVARNTHVLTP